VQLGESVAHNHLFKLLKIHYLWDMCHWDFFYKIKGEGIFFFVVWCNQKFSWLSFSCESWDSKTWQEWKLFLHGNIWVLLKLWLLCVAPLLLEGIRGKKSTPSIDWKVRWSPWIGKWNKGGWAQACHWISSS